MTKSTPSLRERALGYLTRREYSRAELYRKLQPYAGDEDVDALLEEFQQRGWLSDKRYTDQMVHARRGKDAEALAALDPDTLTPKEALDAADAGWAKESGKQPVPSYAASSALAKTLRFALRRKTVRDDARSRPRLHRDR